MNLLSFHSYAVEFDSLLMQMQIILCECKILMALQFLQPWSFYRKHPSRSVVRAVPRAPILSSRLTSASGEPRVTPQRVTAKALHMRYLPGLLWFTLKEFVEIAEKASAEGQRECVDLV